MSFEQSLKSAGKLKVFYFLLVSLIFHVAMMVFFSETREVQEQFSILEVGLVSLSPRVAEERSVHGEPPGKADEVASALPAGPQAEKKEEDNAAILSDVVSRSPDPPPLREPARGTIAKGALRPPQKRIFSERPPPSETDVPAEKSAGSLPDFAEAGRPLPALESVEFIDNGRAGASVPLTEAKPRYDRSDPPPYPRLARKRGWEGEVLLRVLVSAAGDVRNVSIERSSKHAVLDAAALHAVRRWSFHPARLGETPVEREVYVPLRFHLREF